MSVRGGRSRTAATAPYVARWWRRSSASRIWSIVKSDIVVASVVGQGDGGNLCTTLRVSVIGSFHAVTNGCALRRGYPCRPDTSSPAATGRLRSSPFDDVVTD